MNQAMNNNYTPPILWSCDILPDMVLMQSPVSAQGNQIDSAQYNEWSEEL